MSIIEIIILDECENCGKDFEYKSRPWYLKKVILCDECFVESLLEIDCKGNKKRLCSDLNCKKCYLKSFASHFRSLYWSEKNKLKSREVFISSGKNFIFKCDCEHEFEIKLNNITNNGNWCSYCTNQKLCDDNNCDSCFKKSFASSDMSKYWSEKNKLNPRSVFKHSGKKFIFKCDCEHEFESVISSISNGCWCSYCGNRKLCDDNNCDSCFKKSFASSNRSKYWSEKNKLKPREVFKGSDKKFIFNCNDCNHEFESVLNSISNNGYWCSYCSNRKLCDDNNCDSCFKKSFASSNKSKYWSEKNKLNPRSLFLNCNKKFIFKCDCEHEFESTLNNIANDRWCPYCTNQKLCDDNKCDSCFKNSFASSDRSKYWSEKNKLTPRSVFKSSGKKFIFKCDCEHEFESKLDNINKNRWCPICKNKTEKLIYEFLLLNYNSTIHQYKPNWCKNTKTGRHLPFDIFIRSLNIIIEVDGIQHFKFIKHFQNNVQNNVDRDIYKSSLALQNNISVIRIAQEDVWNNIIDWKKILVDEIEKLKNTSTPVISYISSDSEIYREHVSYQNLTNIEFLDDDDSSVEDEEIV